MAQKVSVVLEDDLTGGPAEQTVRFAFDGTDYEIDLNVKNAAALHKQLAPYIEHARRAGRAPSRWAGRTRRPIVSALVVSGRGRKSMAWRSVSAGAFRPAWQSNTTRPAGVNPGSNRQAVTQSCHAPAPACPTLTVRPMAHVDLPALAHHSPHPCGGCRAQLDRPGDLGGSDPWEDAESCQHSGSTPMSCPSAR